MLGGAAWIDQCKWQCVAFLNYTIMLTIRPWWNCLYFAFRSFYHFNNHKLTSGAKRRVVASLQLEDKETREDLRAFHNISTHVRFCEENVTETFYIAQTIIDRTTQKSFTSTIAFVCTCSWIVLCSFFIFSEIHFACRNSGFFELQFILTENQSIYVALTFQLEEWFSAYNLLMVIWLKCWQAGTHEWKTNTHTPTIIAWTLSKRICVRWNVVLVSIGVSMTIDVINVIWLLWRACGTNYCC